MDHQDWKEISWDKTHEKPKDMTKKTFIATQIKKGNVTQTLKPGSLNQNKTTVISNIKKIENEEETFKLNTIGTKFGNRIAQARCEKKLTQKQLANALSLPESTIKNYENGKAIYNAVIVNKIEKILDKRLRE